MKERDTEQSALELPPDINRLAPFTNVSKFLTTLDALQGPCPWGELSQGEGTVDGQIPYIPLGLALGAGHWTNESTYEKLAQTGRFGKLVFSDVLVPRVPRPEYLKFNIVNPEDQLFGRKVHALMSMEVFKYDGTGINFRSAEEEMATAQKLSDLLMPGGIIANCNNGPAKFEQHLLQLGFQIVRSDPRWGLITLQKPFE